MAYTANDNTEYDLAGSFTVIFDPTFGLSSVCGTTRFGSANVFTAFKSGPVNVSNASTLGRRQVVPVDLQLLLVLEIAVHH